MDRTASLVPHNTFEFYLPLPNDTRIYRVTYKALYLFEVAQLLNKNINLSHIPDYEFPHHYNIQSLIKQRFGPQFIQPPYVPSAPSSAPSSAPQTTFEFYLSNDLFIYHITYTELHPFEIAQLLNNNNNNNFYCYNSQSLIEPPVEFQNYQNSIQQQIFDDMSIQDYNIHSANSDSEDMQGTEYVGYAEYDETAPTQPDY
ncbi:unnamed protein product [Rhizophagus irregularis]|nr:unnamed protein product [Rhizophagus irregularis]